MGQLHKKHNKLVMIVDDDLQVRILLGEALKSAGLKVKLAESGEEALKMLADCTPDLILLDVIMPGMDGFKVCSRILDNPKTHKIPIVMVTATNDQESVKRAYEMGVIDFISKPISWGVIGYRVNFLLRAIKSFSRLKTSERRLARTQSIAKVGNWEWILKTDRTWFSAEAQRILRFESHEEYSFQSFIDTICAQDQPILKDAVKDALVHSGSFSIDHQIVQSDGTTCYVHTEAEVVRDWNGTPILMEGTILDITERKRNEKEKLELERQCQQTQKLESLGILAGGVAHDFNNILSAILGHCFIAKTEPEQTENNISQIEKSAEHAAELCRLMMTYAGKAKLTKTQVNIWTVVDELMKMLKATINKNVEIKTTALTDIPYVKADTSQIRQVVMNLIINAAEAVDQAHGEIQVSLAKKVFTQDQPVKDHFGKNIPAGDYLCLEITDNGCGMGIETIDRIFEPFYTTKSSGRGLGMSAVLGIISAHDGALQLYSQPGSGTSFKIYLPVEDIQASEENLLQGVGSTPWKGSGRILLVDDNESILLGVSAMLRYLGFSVINASNGRDALELYQCNATDIILVITDLDMPIMNGYDLLLEFRIINPDLPVIISSGYEDSDLIGQKDVAVLLRKPYSIEQLKETVKRVLESTDRVYP